MHISVSKSGGVKNAKYHSHFHTIDVGRETFKKHIISSIWSPMLWRNGVRGNANFLACSMVVLDFDSGIWSISDTIDFLNETGYKGFMGTTKSHQKEKVTPLGVVSPPCDRFRLCLILEKPITDLTRYRMQMVDIMKAIPVDKSCKDGGRFFYPCTEIIWERAEGNYFPAWLDDEYDARLINIKANQEARRQVNKALRDKSMLPAWLATALVCGAPEGQRHFTCYKMGAELFKFGWETQEIVDAIVATPTSAIGEADILRAVENGIRGVEEFDLF
jgi:hypothetical protein